uniref:Uncharacterized protein n=1 Tax=Glossina pallidipes TaxID=7398 RepID=A0A1A9ZUS7_GLOPL
MHKILKRFRTALCLALQRDTDTSSSGGTGNAETAGVDIGSGIAEVIDMLSPNSPDISALSCSSDKSKAGFEIAGTVTLSITSLAIDDRRRLPMFCSTASLRKTSSNDSALYCWRSN